MRKLLFSVITVSSMTCGADNKLFQDFDNQFNLGYGMNQMSVKNSQNSDAQVTDSYLSFEVEKLFEMGVWFRVNANLVTSSLTNQSTGYGSTEKGSQYGVLNQSPNLGGIDGSVGYSFELLPNLQLIPYGYVGRNTNLTMATAINNQQANITNDYFYTLGMGARLEYRINSAIDVYFDQLANYNWDQSGPTSGISPVNLEVFVSTLGAKFNIYENFQVGVNAYYSNYQVAGNLSTDALTGASVFAPQAQQQSS